MKKLTLALLTFLTTGALSALPVANPVDASLYTRGIWWNDSGCDPCDPCFSWCDAFSMRIGFWGDYVFNRYMQEDVKVNNNQGEVDQFTIYKNQGVLTLNWCDWFDIYGLVGTANFSQRTPFLVGGFDEMVGIEYQAAVSFGGGLRATLWECGGFGLGIEAQYFGARPTLESFTNFGTGIVTHPNNVKNSSYNEWQVGIGTSYRVDSGYGNAFIPYIAIKFAGSELDQRNATYVSSLTSITQGNLESSKTVGYAVGMTTTVCERGGLTVEGRFGDELAVFVNGQLRF